MRFADIPGNEVVKHRLAMMADRDRVPHAILLHGIPGIGKLSMARAMAQYLNCENRNNGDSCGECPSCKQISSFNLPDSLFVFPVVKTEKIKNPVSDDYIDQFKEFVKSSLFMDFDGWGNMFDKKNAQPQIYVSESERLEQRLAITSTTARYKTVIMWLPEKMNEAAANKLLKLIEEPIGNTVFFLASDSVQDVLPTIKSRCQPIEMLRLSDETIARLLESKRGLNHEDAMAQAHIAEGSATRALNVTDASDSSRLFHVQFMSLMRLAYSRNVAELKSWANALASSGREQQARFYEYCQRMVRENFFNNFNQPSLVYLNYEEREFASRFSKFIHERNAEKMIKVFQDAISDILANANAKIVNFDVAVKIIMLLRL